MAKEKFGVALDEELAIDLGEDVEVTTEILYEVLAGASAGGTSINHVCETTDDSPHANTVRGHLTDQFELDAVEAVGDTLLQRDALETLPDRPVEVAALRARTWYREFREVTLMCAVYNMKRAAKQEIPLQSCD